MDALQNAFFDVMTFILGSSKVSWHTLVPALLAIAVLRGMLWASLKSMTLREFGSAKLYVVTALVIVIPILTSMVGLAYWHPMVTRWLSGFMVAIFCGILGLLVLAVPTAALVLRAAYLRVLGAAVTALFIGAVVLVISGALIGMFSNFGRQSIKMGVRRHATENFIGK